MLPGRNPALLAKELGEPRRAVRRAAAARRSGSASRTRPSSRRSASPARSGRRGSTRRSRSSAGFWTEDAVDHDGDALPLRGPARCCRSRCSSRPTCGSAARRQASCAGSAGSATAGSPSFSTPADVRRGTRPVIEEAAAAAEPGDRPRALRRDGLLLARRDPGADRAADRDAATPTPIPTSSSRSGSTALERSSSATSTRTSRSSCSCPPTTRRRGRTSSARSPTGSSPCRTSSRPASGARRARAGSRDRGRSRRTRGSPAPACPSWRGAVWTACSRASASCRCHRSRRPRAA